MNLEKAIDILENVIADEVIGIYCLEIQKEVECSKNCENEDCFLQQAIDTVLNELNNNVSKYYINSLLNKYKRVEKYQKENHSPRHSTVKVKGKIEVLKEILKHEEEE